MTTDKYWVWSRKSSYFVEGDMSHEKAKKCAEKEARKGPGCTFVVLRKTDTFVTNDIVHETY